MREHLGIAAIVLIALILRVAFALSLPPWQAPDERAHWNNVVHLREHRELPAQPVRTLEMFTDPLAQAYQPPLAYLLFLPPQYALSAVNATSKTRLRAARIQNACYGALTVFIGAMVAARLTRSGDRRRLLVALVLAFLPGFVVAGSAVNNDSLANLLAASFWLMLIPGEGRRLSMLRAGGVLGAACLAKLSCLTLVPLLLVVPWLGARRPIRECLRFAAGAMAIAFMALLPWMVRNVWLYGDPLAIGVGSLSFEWLATQIPAAELDSLARVRPGNVFFQFFGRFGAANNLSWLGIPLVTLALTLLAGIGWLRASAHRPLDSFERWAPVAGIAVAIALVGLVAFSLRAAGAWQGRYLYGAMLPIALLLAAGWGRLLADSKRWIVVTAIVAALVIVDVIALAKVREFYASQPPATWMKFTPL